MSLFDDDTPSLSPVQFFGITADCYTVKGKLKPDKDHLLPSTSDLLAEDAFADVYAGWTVDKLCFHITVNVPFQKIGEGDYRKGDSVEIFIDTRDLKTKSTVSKFCHHFIFFPALAQNFYGREITRFRGDDMHRLCHPEDLQVTPKIEKKGYSIAIEIPAHCLHGFDPLSFSRIGFTYRINRAGGAPQHFAVSSEEYNIEQHPATWGTLKLEQE
jgi:hypothetical protein